MLQETAERALAATGSAWLRPWRVLLLGLGAVLLGSGLLTCEERYKITDGSLDALRTAGLPEMIVGPVATLKGQEFERREQLEEAVAKLLPADVLVVGDMQSRVLLVAKDFGTTYSTKQGAADEGPIPGTIGSGWEKPLNLDEERKHAVDLVVDHAEVNNGFITPLRMLLLIAGLIAGGWAVNKRLTTAGDGLDERVESAGLVAVYCLFGLIGFMGMPESWFSGRIFFAFFILYTILGSLLILLPRLWRALAVTVLAILHFGGILVAVTSMQATNGQTPWLPAMLNSKLYRPYLTGMYLTNAYHFYAPDPGSSTIVWIRIEYADGTYIWHKYPSRPESITPLHYQRMMGICEGTSGTAYVDPTEIQRLLGRRETAGQFYPRGPIPLRSDRLPQTQFAPPNEYSQVILSSMAFHAYRYFPHPTDPSIPAVSVKIYRLIYTIITPTALVEGGDPTDDSLKMPIYMGEYNRDGKRVYHDNAGNLLPPQDDPFVFWVVPIEKVYLHAGDKVSNGEEKQQ